MVESKDIKQKGWELGFDKIGIAAISPTATALAAERLQAWLALGYQADMHWMASPKRRDIFQVMPSARSLICVALNYYTPQQRPPGDRYAKISRYGWGRDYHKVMGSKLKSLTLWLAKEGWQVRHYVDTGPVQDKFWAQQAGIGWIAKNGNVISREFGSWIFLGEIITDAELEPDSSHDRHCGTCTRCLDACPTQAITAPFVVDANRCIAYHTIENRASQLPESLDLAGWVAGCDICQDVCPWNIRFAKETKIADFQPYRENIAPTLSEIAEISDCEWDRRFRASALRRIKPEMLRRNARHQQQ